MLSSRDHSQLGTRRGRRPPTFLLGLPTLSYTLLWRTAVRLEAPVLISANALSTWRRDAAGNRWWSGFNTRNLHLVGTHPVTLDSGGFVAAALYNGFEWSVDEYIKLCASAPWRRFFSQDWCVEPEITGNHDAVLDRISGTVRLNMECIYRARDRGIIDRFSPVIQGWKVDDYLRCIDRMPCLDEFDVIGVGSMCRRHVEGPDGIVQVLDALDRAFGNSPVTLHLFGVKAQGMEAIRDHPRVASFDSQAYGVSARKAAHKARVSKTDAFLAMEMERWFLRQKATIEKPGFVFRTPDPLPSAAAGPVLSPLFGRIDRAREELRRLHEQGEIEWNGVSDLAALEFAFLDEEDCLESIPAA